MRLPFTVDQNQQKNAGDSETGNYVVARSVNRIRLYYCRLLSSGPAFRGYRHGKTTPGMQPKRTVGTSFFEVFLAFGEGTHKDNQAHC